MLPFRYVGHPFIDVGVATLVTFAGVQRPEELTEAHVQAFIEYVVPRYTVPSMRKFFHGAALPNLRPFHPTIKDQAEQHRSLRALLNLYHGKAEEGEKGLVLASPGDVCIFSGDPALIRVSRSALPLTTGAHDINFVPQGEHGLPIAGWCMTALLAMPLGTLASKGRLWLVHTHDYTLLQQFVARSLQKNRRALHMQSLEEGGQVRLATVTSAKTHLVMDLIQIRRDAPPRAPLTAYFFTNYNQGAKLDIFHLPSNIVEFITTAHRLYPRAWDEIVKRAWELQTPQAQEDGTLVFPERNFFYEDLFELPHNARSFLRRYLLRSPRRGKPRGKAQKQDPRFTYSFVREGQAIHWGLTELFLEQVMSMDKERIQNIRNLADRLSDYVIRHNDDRLFKRLYMARDGYKFRLGLQKAAIAAQKTEEAPLLPYDEFISAFFEDDGETVRPDWYLARDLLMIRMIERLHANRWIAEHPELVDELSQSSDQPAEES